jgi:hypothetical protein
MLKRSLAAVIALGLLLFGATVSLEALGLLFHAAVPDLQQRVDAFVARLEADLSPVDLPEEPVEVPHEAAQELAGHDAERAAAAEPALQSDGAATAAEVADAVEPDRHNARVAAAFSSAMPDLPPNFRPETATEPEEGVAPAPVEPQEPAAVPAPLPAVQPASAAPIAGPPALRATGVHRATSARGPVGYAAFGWPLLDWLTL